MPFRYPAAPHRRRHGPRGYSTYEAYRPWLRDEFSFRCVYCLYREQWGRIRRAFEIDHFLAIASDPSLRTDYDNLLYVCTSCNSSKRDRKLPDPLRALVDGDIRVGATGEITGRSREARRIVRVLGLDSVENVEFRRLWLDIIALARRVEPELYVELMRYPENLPNLARQRPPSGNSRPEGIAQSRFEKRRRGELEEIY